MILGRKLAHLVRVPALRLRADSARCTNCNTCSANCPASLDVNAMVQAGKMEACECILCGSCVDACPARAIRYTFGTGR